MSEDTKPRARNVFDIVSAKQGVQPEPQAAQASEPGALLVEKPQEEEPGLLAFLFGAADREKKRFAALTGVFGIHIATGLITFPVSLVALKVVVSALLTAFGSEVVFTWLTATLLSGGLAIAGPLVGFLYRYWVGRY